MFNKLNFSLDHSPNFCYTEPIMKTTLGNLLQLPSFHHFSQLPISPLTEPSHTYIITFGMTDEPLFVDLDSPIGQTNQARMASHFQQDTLFIGLGAVPLDQLDTCQLLEVPAKTNHKGIDTPNLLAYHGHLPLFRKMAEQLRAREQMTVYDPYRYSYTINEKQKENDRQLTIVPRKEYEKIRDFHPFLQTNRGKVYAVPAYYHDRKREKVQKIYLMGWYFYEKQLKLSWKPSHSRKSRWRSSIVSVDKKTDRFFFQGELYKKGSYPIFLDSLELTNKTYQERLDREFSALLQIINEQKQKALLRLKTIGR